MVSLEAGLSSKDRIGINFLTVISGADQSKKRKRDEAEAHNDVDICAAATELKLWCTNRSRPPPHVVGDVELQLEDSPLPPEWQRCLDIKSGEIHFYNTRTRKRTTSDPRLRTQTPPGPRPVLSLDLDLNLGCDSPATKEEEEEKGEKPQRPHERKRGLDGGSPPGEVDYFRRDMMAAVCMRCHMLVMMCRSTPSCPNCKFLHPRTDGMTAVASEKPGRRQIDVLGRILDENNLRLK